MLGLKNIYNLCQSCQGTMVVFEFKFSRTRWEESSWKNKKNQENLQDFYTSFKWVVKKYED
jgi:hypothetical protein